MTRTAVVAGVGPGLGASLANRLSTEGCQVGVFARSAYAEELAADLRAAGGQAVGARVDVGDRAAVAEGFAAVREAFGPVDILVNNASQAPWSGVDVDPAAFEESLRVGPVGSLNCTQEAVGDMREAGGGTIIFTGATSAVRGREGALGFSAAKFATRGMAGSLARELGPEGIHVAHVIVDGQILGTTDGTDRPEEAFLDPDAVADSYWHLVEQDRSAWTLELDLRPHVEEF
jgi:NAD(P)-dependent dehydrogenase (short-subunit alcohol dehydrogenase family)